MTYQLVDETNYAPDGSKHYFLVVDNTPVAYVKIYLNYKGHDVSIADIETRDGYRRKGYGTKLLEMLMIEHNTTDLRHSGSHSEDGLAFARSVTNGEETKEKAEYETLSFVHDWNEMQRKYH